MRICRKLTALLLAVTLLAGFAFAEDMIVPDGGVDAEVDAELVEEIDGLDLTIEDTDLVIPEPVANTGDDATAIKIDSKNFPAKAFRDYVKAHFDADGDNELSKAEADAVTEIILRSREQYDNGEGSLTCTTLKGIEHFVNLWKLEAVGCGLTTLDVSKNVNLVHLDCKDNNIKKLDVSKNRELTFLVCEEAQQTQRQQEYEAGGVGLPFQ